MTELMSMVNSVEFWAATMVSAESATAAVKERILAEEVVVKVGMVLCLLTRNPNRNLPIDLRLGRNGIGYGCW